MIARAPFDPSSIGVGTLVLIFAAIIVTMIIFAALSEKE